MAKQTNNCFLHTIGSKLVQRYVSEGARMVRKLFTMNRAKCMCSSFFDKINAFDGACDGSGTSTVPRSQPPQVLHARGRFPSH
jgi:proteasome regulatory subunit